MKLLKNRNFHISALVGTAFALSIYPYGHDMYIPELFTAICAVLNLLSAVIFSALLYLKLEGKFPSEDMGYVILLLMIQAAGHGLFAMMSWGSWVCLGITAVILLACWISWRRTHPLTKEQKRRRIALVLGLVLAGGCVLGYFSSPVLRVRAFLWTYQKDLEQRIQEAGSVGEVEGQFFSDPMPALCGIKKFDVWPGNQDMIEFHLFGKGAGGQTSYYGCYYSWEDVPLAYQNADVTLTQDGHDYWQWQAEGDNHGATRKLSEHWYYFEAHF